MRLDEHTADRILAGEVDPADAPPGFEAVVTLLETARAAASVARARRSPMSGAARLKRRLPVIAAVAALSVMTGAAYASGLPSAASATTSAVLQRLEITPPGATSHAYAGLSQARVAGVRAFAAPGMEAGKGSHIRAAPIERGSTARHDPLGASRPHKGAEVSTLARTTSATGKAKGATISTVASGGKRNAGGHGRHGSRPGGTRRTGPRRRHAPTKP